MKLLLLALAAAAALARAETCHNYLGQVVNSTSSTLCVECSLNGYLFLGVCVCPQPQIMTPTCVLVPSSVVPVTSTCGSGFCHDDDGVCVLSAFGVRCQECGLGNMGFIINNPDLTSPARTICSCYSSESDPNAQCQVGSPRPQAKLTPPPP